MTRAVSGFFASAIHSASARRRPSIPSGTKAEVLVIEPTGSETQVTLNLGGQDLVGVFRERINAAPGESIGIAFDTSLLHLFDAETGKRIQRGRRPSAITDASLPTVFAAGIQSRAGP